MKPRDYVLIAENLARVWHHGQFRRDGKTPYVTHPEAVAGAVKGYKAKCVAWMHDLIEDTACPMSKIVCFPCDVFEAVMLLSNIRGEEYMKYINNISKNKIARVVKIADIRHNLSCQPSAKSVKKYRAALAVLLPSNPSDQLAPSGAPMNRVVGCEHFNGGKP